MSQTGRRKANFKDTLTSHLSKDFHSEGMSNSDDDHSYSVERIQDDQHDIEDYDEEEYSNDADDKTGPVDEVERYLTPDPALKLNIFQSKQSSSQQEQRSFLPKRSRKLSPSQTTDLRAQQIQQFRVSRQSSNKADLDIN